MIDKAIVDILLENRQKNVFPIYLDELHLYCVAIAIISRDYLSSI